MRGRCQRGWVASRCSMSEGQAQNEYEYSLEAGVRKWQGEMNNFGVITYMTKQTGNIALHLGA